MKQKCVEEFKTVFWTYFYDKKKKQRNGLTIFFTFSNSSENKTISKTSKKKMKQKNRFDRIWLNWLSDSHKIRLRMNFQFASKQMNDSF